MTDAAANIAIEIRKLSFFYENELRPALTDVSLRIGSGETVVLIGASGCGKTTLCRVVTGVIPHILPGELRGEVFVFGQDILRGEGFDIGKHARQAGFVLQEPDHQIVMTTAEDDIAFGPENLMEAPEQIRATVTEMLETVGLPGMALRSPGKMSGGEKQRLAIGGVLALNPQILVFDEPGGGLDKDGRARFTDIVKQLKAAGHTVLIVEHDFEFLDFAERWVLMKDGSILCDAAPDAVPKELLEDGLWH